MHLISVLRHVLIGWNLIFVQVNRKFETITYDVNPEIYPTYVKISIWFSQNTVSKITASQIFAGTLVMLFVSGMNDGFEPSNMSD